MFIFLAPIENPASPPYPHKQMQCMSQRFFPKDKHDFKANGSSRRSTYKAKMCVYVYTLSPHQTVLPFVKRSWLDLERDFEFCLVLRDFSVSLSSSTFDHLLLLSSFTSVWELVSSSHFLSFM